MKRVRPRKETTLATKKTTRKRAKRTKKTPATEAAEAADTAETTASAPTSKAAKKTKRKAAASKAAKKTTKAAKKTAKKKTRKKTTATRVKSAAAEDVADTRTNEVTRLEGEDGSIVIRFPPVAPSPFAELARAEAAAPPTVQEPDTPADVAEMHVVNDEDVDDAVEPPDASTAEPAAAERGRRDDDESDEPRKRRRRRRRGRRGGRDRREDAADTTDRESGAQEFATATRAPDEEDTVDNVAAEAEEADEPRRRGGRGRGRSDTDAGVEMVESDDEDDALLVDLDIDDSDDDEDEDDDDSATAVADEDDDEAEAEAETADDEQDDRQRGRRRRGRRRGRFDNRRDESVADGRERPDRLRGRRREKPIDLKLDESPKRRKMIINYVPRDECRIAILADDRLEEIYLERASYENHVGSIYKGVVTNVESSIQAAFVDFGMGKNGFLHITDLHPDYMPGASKVEAVGRKMPRRARPPIQKCLKRGQELIVQITKEGIGTKGPTLSTYVSIPGRFLVMMPGMDRNGVSRKIEDDDVRVAIRKQLAQLEKPKGIAFIARTAAEGRSVEELQSDLNYLERLWKAVQRRIKNEKAPTELYRESDLVVRTIRDVYADDIEEIIVDDPEVAERAREFLSVFRQDDGEDFVKIYDGSGPIFHRYKIEQELEKLHSRRVPLKSGGSLVIEATEALVAIDVNSGRFRTEDDAESTAFKINQEAADEIARQLRLRDLGGVVVCDFIDMREEKHKREIEQRLIARLKQHKERAKVLRMSQFGIIELTRQRQRASLTRNVYHDCASCRGTGLIKTLESVMIDVTRQVHWAASREHVNQIEVTLAPSVAELVLNRKRGMLFELEREHRRTITVKSNAGYTPDQMHIECYDGRGRQVPMD
jgi:ribonuclease E